MAWLLGVVPLLLGLFCHIPWAEAQDMCAVLDICFLVDSSGSIRDNNPIDNSYDNWNLQLTFIRNIIDDSRIKIGPTAVQIGVIYFSNNAHLYFDLDDYTTKSAITGKIAEMPYEGGTTNTYEAFLLARTQCFNTTADRNYAPNLVFIITDGVPTVPEPQSTARDLAIAENDKLKNPDQWSRGATVFSIGVTDSIDKDLLRIFSSPPQIEGLTYFSSPDFNSLPNLLDQILNTACAISTPRPVPSTTPGSCPLIVDLGIVMDQSSSIDWDDPGNWGLMKSFVVDVVQAFPIGIDQTRVGVVKFSTSASLEFGLDRYTDVTSLTNAINDMRLEGGDTNIALALDVLRTQLFNTGADRRDVPNIGIFITDGEATINRDNVESSANAAQNSGIDMFAIGITANVNLDELNTIASEPKEYRVWQVENFESLLTIINDIVKRTCDAASVTTPLPTLPPVRECNGDRADVVFVVDASGSIGENNFNKIIEFMRSIVNQLDVDTGRIRVGMVTFSTSTNPEFNLNDYNSRGQILNALENVKYLRGTTNTADALSYAHRSMFTELRGDRSDASDLVIVITDGESNDPPRTIEESRHIKTDGITVISVGIGNWLNEYELLAMASYPSDRNNLRVDNYDSLNQILYTLRDAICDNDRECNSNPCQNGQCRDAIRYWWCECYGDWAGQQCNKRCATAGDIVFVLDASGSVGVANFQKMIDFTIDAVNNLNIDRANSGNQGSRVGLLTYASTTNPQFDLDDYMNKINILNAVGAVRYTGGTTNTADAIKYARENYFQPSGGDRNGVPNYLVIMTDGKSNQMDDTWQEAMLARQAGIYIVSVGIGGGTDEQELRGMASDPVDQNVLSVSNFDSLNSISDRLTNSLCNTENACNSNPCRNGARCQDTMNGYTCSPCPDGWTGLQCERQCSGKADLVFILDSSGSIRRERFPLVKQFIQDIVASLDVHQDRTRVGLVYWSDNAYNGFYMDQYTTRNDVMMAVDRIPFIGGRTHTSDAIVMARDDYFVSARGDRDDVSDFIIIITDGNSNIESERTIPEAIDTRIRGIHISALSVGTDLNMIELEGIVSDPKQANIFAVNSINALPGITSQMINSICDDRDECRSNPCQNGGRCDNRLSYYYCYCQSEYSGYNCNRRCGRSYDVALILDLSGSMEEEYQLTMELARQIVYGLNMQGSRVRFGVVAFATDVISFFTLNTHLDTESVVNALNYYHDGGKTNTQAALQIARNEIFRSNNGDRDGIPNIAIVISDGGSNVNEYNTIPEANNMRNQGIEVFSMATGDSPDLGEMNSIANDPDSEHVYTVRNLGEVDSAVNRLLNRLCQ